MPLGHTDIAHVQVTMFEADVFLALGQSQDDSPEDIPGGPDVL